MIAMTTEQGTACGETGLCWIHDTLTNRKIAETQAQAPLHAGNPAVPGSWTDCTSNGEIFCLFCGKYSD